MATKVQKPCKICGKMFTPCADCENDKTMFRWKRVACSPECAKKYFAKIEESRQLKTGPEIRQDVHNDSLPTSDVDDVADVETVKPRRGRKKNIDNEEREQID